MHRVRNIALGLGLVGVAREDVFSSHSGVIASAVNFCAISWIWRWSSVRSNWVMAQPFKEAAKSEFLSGGDPWLIAKAKVIGATVVTQETFDAQSRKKVKIPNVCRALSVPYINTFDLLRQTGATFTLRG